MLEDVPEGCQSGSGRQETGRLGKDFSLLIGRIRSRRDWSRRRGREATRDFGNLMRCRGRCGYACDSILPA